MIVDSMTHQEVYAELAKDREAVTKWWWHQKESMRRRVLKSTRFPLHFWLEYTSPRKNRYLFITNIFEKRMRNLMTGIAAWRYTSEGLTVYTNWLEGQKRIRPVVLTPHMWKRYVERMKVDKSGVDLVKHYLYNNSHGRDTRNNRAMARSVRWNGEDHQACCVNDGVLLGHVKDDIYIVKTFITYDMTCGLQQEEFDGCRQKIKTDMDLYNKFMLYGYI